MALFIKSRQKPLTITQRKCNILTLLLFVFLIMNAKDLKKASGGKKKDLTNKLTKQAKEQKKRVKMDETEYLLSTKANRENLLESIKEIERGEVTRFESIDALKKHYGI